MRRFYLFRKEDPTGMSSTGRVADGIEFDNGQVALTWKKEFPSVTVFPSVSIVEKLHSHNGKDPTKIIWVDDMGEDLEDMAATLRAKKKEEEEAEEAAEQAAQAAAEKVEEMNKEQLEEELTPEPTLELTEELKGGE